MYMWKQFINVKLEINISCLCYGRLCFMYHLQFMKYNNVPNISLIKFPLNVLKFGYLIGARDTHWEENGT